MRCPASTTTTSSTRSPSSAAESAAHPRGPHPPRARRRLHGARRRAGDGKAAGLLRGAGPGPAQLLGGSAHRLRHECSGAGADRANSAGRHRPLASRIFTRSATRPASWRGSSTGRRASRRRTRRRALWPRRCAPCSSAGPVRRRSNAPSMSGGAPGRSAPRRRSRFPSRRSTKTPCKPPPSASAPPRGR